MGSVRQIHARIVLLTAAAAMVLAAPAFAAPGDITTVAGSGTSGYSGDGGPATAAKLNFPNGAVPTPDGGFLIVDYGNSRIRKVLNGTITTVAGTGVAGYSGDGGLATMAKINFPTGVATTPDGGFLIADKNNSRIRKVGADGIITTVAGTGSTGFSGDGGLATAAALNLPTGIAPTPDGGFLIVDQQNARIRKVSPDGVITTVAGNGTFGYSGDNGPATAAMLNTNFVASTPDGGFLIADSSNHRIRKVANGTITTVAGNGTSGFSGDGGPATAAQLTYPDGAASTPDGGFLIADKNNNRIRKVLNGQITTLAGSSSATGFSGDGGPATAAKLDTPIAVAVTADGGFLITDEFNQRIRQVEGVATPSVLGTTPASPNDQKSITVTGTAPAGSTVSLFTSATCSGAVVAGGSAAEFGGPGLSVTVGAGSTTTFHASASQNGYTSACSTTAATYTQADLTPPATKLKKAKISSKAHTAKFVFTSSEAGSRFQCRLDRQEKFSKCRSPKTYKHLKPGKHTFRVRATDAAGNTDKTPAKRVFRITRPRH